MHVKRVIRRSELRDRMQICAKLRSAVLIGWKGVSARRRSLFTRPPTINLSNSSFLVWGSGTDVGKTLVCAAYAYYAEKFEVKDAIERLTEMRLCVVC